MGPRLASLERLSADFRDFLANFGPPCVFPSIEGAPGQYWDRFWVSQGASRKGFYRILGRSWRRFGHSLHLSFVPTSSQVCPNSRSVVALPLVLALVGRPFSCRGGGLAERVKFAVPQRGAGVVLDGSVKSPVPEGLPFLTFPAASARPPTLPSKVEMMPFF